MDTISLIVNALNDQEQRIDKLTRKLENILKKIFILAF
jgi:DNA-binding HxlR family transcriptional regulator